MNIPNKKHSQLSRWIFVIITVIFVLLAFRESILPALGNIKNVQLLSTLPIAFLCATVGIASSVSFSLLVHAESDIGNRKVWKTACIYLVAQLVKYLPGRIWGFIYQVQMLSNNTPTGKVISATMNHIVLTTILTIALLLYAVEFPYSGISLVVFFILASLYVRHGGATSFLSLFLRRHTASNSPTTWRVTFSVMLFLAIEWVAYFSVWALLVDSIERDYEFLGILRVGALYSGAWLIGSLLTIFPNGIAVREGTYVAIGVGLGFPDEYLVTTGVLARLAFTSGELLTGMVAYYILRSVNNDTSK